MVTLLESVLLGVIQGITEWLPVSSSGHLVITQQLLGLNVPVLFDLLLHVGTALVVVLFMRKEVAQILQAVIKGDFSSPEGKLALFIIIGSIPTAIIGFAFQDFFASLFFNLRAVGVALLITGAFLFISERFERSEGISVKKSLWMGLAQGLAIIPGISRSGATIGTGLLLGVEKERAARFSFLLAVPAILGAGLYEARNLSSLSSLGVEVLVGVAVAMIIGYITLGLLLRIVVAQKLKYFAIYCWLVGLAILIL